MADFHLLFNISLKVLISKVIKVFSINATIIKKIEIYYICNIRWNESYLL